MMATMRLRQLARRVRFWWRWLRVQACVRLGHVTIWPERRPAWVVWLPRWGAGCACGAWGGDLRHPRRHPWEPDRSRRTGLFDQRPDAAMLAEIDSTP